MDTTSSTELEVRRIFDAPRKRVFAAFASADALSQWLFPPPDWTADAECDFREGGSYRIVMHTTDGQDHEHTGEYREIVQGERIVFTWNTASVSGSVVTVVFKEVDDGTEVVLRHELLPDEMVEPHRGGWQGCLENLSRYLARG